MLKRHQETETFEAYCESCGEGIAREEIACGCGRPAPWASFAERNQVEALRWRAYKASLPHDDDSEPTNEVSGS